jgi:SOS-response transcriptional repressor LexA
MDFFQRVKDYVKLANTTIEDLIASVFGNDKDRDSYYGWRRRGVLPRADEATKLAYALKTTVEELVDGEAGAEYVRQLIAKEGKIYEPPEKIREIVKILEGLDNGELKVVEKMISGLSLYDISDSDRYEVHDSEPEYSYSPVVSIKNYLPKTEKIGNVRVVDWDIILLPYYGKTAGGVPIDITIYPNMGVPYPKQRLKGDSIDYYVVQIEGTSMAAVDINNGDYVVIRRAEEPQNGKIMLVRYGNESTLKRIRIRDNKVYLHWEDGSGTERLIDSSEYEIQGEYVAVLRE